jgi:pimeloyl-ACP methyl ester carboxylesterase
MPAELSLRERPVGGLLRPSVREHPSRATGNMRRIDLLIHGYNVSLCRAGCAYGTFESHVRTQSWLTTFARIYWPGDARVPLGRLLGAGLSGALSAATYMAQIRTAKNTATRLFDWFCAGPPPARQPELNIVAHSLGCRVALELLTQFAGQQPTRRPRVKIVTLMAAAVPRYMVEEQGALRSGAELPWRIIAIHSTSDRILKWVFRAGQAQEALADAYDALRWNARGAIGRHGLPSLPGRSNVPALGADHSDYWPSPVVADDVNMSHNGILRLGVSRPATPPARELTPRTIDVRQVAYRAPAARTVGGQQGLCRTCPACE